MEPSHQNKQNLLLSLIHQHLNHPTIQLENHIFQLGVKDTKFFDTIGKIIKHQDIPYNVKLAGIMMAVFVVKKSHLVSSMHSEFKNQKYSIKKVLNRLQLLVNDSQIPLVFREHLLRYYITYSWECHHQTFEKLSVAVRYQFMSGSQQLAFLMSYYILQLQGPRNNNYQIFFQKNIQYILSNCLALLIKFNKLQHQSTDFNFYKYWVQVPLNTLEIILSKYSFDVYETLAKYFKSLHFIDIIEQFKGNLFDEPSSKTQIQIRIKFKLILCKLYKKCQQYQNLQNQQLSLLLNKMKEYGLMLLNQIDKNYRNKAYQFNDDLINENIETSTNLNYLLIKSKLLSYEIIDINWLINSLLQIFEKQICKYYGNPKQFTILLTDLSYYMQSQTILTTLNLLLNQVLEQSSAYNLLINRLLYENQQSKSNSIMILFASCILVKGIMQRLQLEQRLQKFVIKNFKSLCYENAGISKQYFYLIWFYRTYNDDILLDSDANQIHKSLLKNLFQIAYEPNSFSQLIFVMLLTSIQEYFNLGFPFKQQQQKIAIALCGIKQCINPYYTNLLAIIIKQYHQELDPQFLLEIFVIYMEKNSQCLTALVRNTFRIFFQCSQFTRFFQVLLIKIRGISATYTDIKLEPSQLLAMLKPVVKALKTIPQNYDTFFSNIVESDLKDGQAIYALNLFIMYSNQDINFKNMVVNVFKGCLQILKRQAHKYKKEAQQNLDNINEDQPERFNRWILKQLQQDQKDNYLQQLHCTLLLHIIAFNHSKYIPTEYIIQLLRTIHLILLYKRQAIFDYLTGKTMVLFLILLWKDFNRINSLLAQSRSGTGLDKVLEIDLIRHMIGRQNQYRLGYDSQLFVVGMLQLLENVLDKNQQLLLCADNALLAIILNLDRIMKHKNNKTSNHNLLYIHQNNRIRQFYQLTEQALKNFTFPKQFFQNNEFQLFHRYVEKLYERRESQQWFQRLLNKLPGEVVERMENSKDLWKIQGRYRKIYKVVHK